MPEDSDLLNLMPACFDNPVPSSPILKILQDASEKRAFCSKSPSGHSSRQTEAPCPQTFFPFLLREEGSPSRLSMSVSLSQGLPLAQSLQNFMSMLNPNKLLRYKDVAMLFLRHGNGDLIQQTGFDSQSEENVEAAEEASELANDLEKLGPTFVKIGQMLSTRADLLPPVYLDALSRLQDDVEPISYEAATEVFEDELGVRVSKAFRSFNERPLASASLGQVHRAELHDGRRVVVKIQRPGIRKEISKDLDALEGIAEFMDEHTDFGKKYNTGLLVAQFRRSLLQELDYQREASQLLELKNNLVNFHLLEIPGVVPDFTSSKVLTMDYLPGNKVTSLSGTVIADVDGAVLVEELFKAYLQQILVDGFFHADPHPGNLLLTKEGTIAILDLGMVGRIPQTSRDQLFHLLVGIAEGNGVQVAQAATAIGSQRTENFNRDSFIRRIEDIVGAAKGAQLEKIDMGAIVMEVTQACAEEGIRIPAEIAMLGKTLLNLDRVGAILSPGFNPHDAIRKHVDEIGKLRIKETLTSANLMGMLTESKEFVEQLPPRMNRIFDMVADNKLKVEVDAIDETKLMRGLQTIANRITLGLILSALIVGSSLLMKIETSFTLFGYPGLAILFFLLAALGSILLFLRIWIKDL